MTDKITANYKGKARLAPAITHILLILLIGGIGVQTITFCSSDDDVGDGGSSSSGSGGDKGNAFKDDRDGKSYKWVKIGAQTWMAENLNYNASSSKCYGEGGQVVEYTEDDNDEPITSTLSNAEIQANCTTYGRLYNWAMAKTACPSGWHLPSDEDWNVLMKSVNPSCSDNSDCAGAGTKLKATSGWNDYNGKSGNGTDDFGFSALPGGGGSSDGSFFYVGRGVWWSGSEGSSKDGNSIAYYRRIRYDREDVGYSDYGKDYLFSVRCLQD